MLDYLQLIHEYFNRFCMDNLPSIHHLLYPMSKLIVKQGLKKSVRMVCLFTTTLNNRHVQQLDW